MRRISGVDETVGLDVKQLIFIILASFFPLNSLKFLAVFRKNYF